MPQRNRILLLAVLGALAVSALAAPPSQPDFSGKWTLNAGKSDLGPVPPPKSRTEDIAQKGQHIKVVRAQTDASGKSSTLTLDCPIGGTDCAVNFSDTSVKMAGKAKWDGAVLVFNLTVTTGGGQLTIDDRYTRSADGKTIVVKRHLASMMGAIDQTLVMEKP
ncbi:MAG TPA: hypothetical protein VL382_05265 [Terriglobales bacterium]|nr:hypothetical protein [Terriglobales bacterium]